MKVDFLNNWFLSKSVAKILVFLLTVCLLAQALPAQPAAPISKVDRTYFKKILSDAGMILGSPGQWEKKDWLTFGLCLATTSALLPLDNSIHHQVYDHSCATLTLVSRAVSAAGAPVCLFGLVSAGYLVGHFRNSDKTRETFLMAGESLLITELLVQAGKISIGRARPYTLEGPFSFHPITLQGCWHSFPSGHSAAAWAVASCLASRVRSPYLRAAFLSLASAISLSRIFLDKHFASDVVGAALLGYFVGRKISKPSLMENKPKRANISLNLGHRFVAFGLIYQF
ncbi:MAG: phosphatase PAP2 family protein [Candidatus Saccharicenans sp.]|nr:phosphatase PAP2 family protein [Candidatus Saccharicenans sp.]